MMVLPESSLDNRMCTSCGLIFNAGGTRGRVETFYRDTYRLMMHEKGSSVHSFGGIRPMSIGERSHELLHEMIPDLPVSGRLLEAGAGKGEFLQHFHTARPDWELDAFEPGSAVTVLRERVPAARVQQVSYPDFAGEAEGYDLAVSLGVLEHVENPLDMLKWLHRQLRPGGMLFLRVPNFANNPNDLFAADHLSKLTPETLGQLCTAAGFDVDSMRGVGVPIFIAARKAEHAGGLVSVVDANTSLCEMNARIADATLRAIDQAHEVSRARGEGFGIFGLAGAGLFWPLLRGVDPGAIAAYLDDNKGMWGNAIHGRRVGGSDLIPELGIRHVALSMSPAYFQQVKEKLDGFGVTVYHAEV